MFRSTARHNTAMIKRRICVKNKNGTKRLRNTCGKYKRRITGAYPVRRVLSARCAARPVAPEGAGSRHRNHCPKCLSSVHEDHAPGDRASLCKGIMDPIGVWVRKNGEWALIHRCRSCGAIHSNRVAADDNPALLMSIAVRPLADPPFPMSTLEQQFGNKTD